MAHKIIPRKGHENTATTQVYIHADLALKERAIARTAPQDTTPGRYQPADDILGVPRRAVIMPTVPASRRGPPGAPVDWSA